MKLRWSARWAGLALLALAPLAAAAESAEEILKKIDRSINPYRDRVFTITMTTRDPGGSPRKMVMRCAERGQGKQRIMLFKEPADLKGMGILSQDRDTLYVYLPDYHRVRRLAMHAKKQSFQGSVYTFDDMAQITYSEDYRPKVTRDAEKELVLELTPRPGRELQYSKIVAVADKATWQFTELRYFSPEGDHVKTETRWNYKPIDGGGARMNLKMVEERSKTETTIEVLEMKVNVGLSERLFTKRGLIRGKL